MRSRSMRAASRSSGLATTTVTRMATEAPVTRRDARWTSRSIASPATTIRPRFPRRWVSRADQAVKLVGENPGISASEIAEQMKIKPNYLYRVLSELEKEGRVRKDGRSYHPAG